MKRYKNVGAKALYIADGYTIMVKKMNREEKLKMLKKQDEKMLTKKFLIPLFSEGMGCKNVQYTHGILEFGKDIVYCTEDEFGNRRYTGVQVKATKVTARRADTILNQISRAFGERFTNLNDGKKMGLDRFVLITSGEFTGVAKESLSSSLRNFNLLGNVIFIDGNKLVDLLDEYLPSAFWDDTFLGRKDRASYIIRSIEGAIKECKRHKREIDVRMRALFTSMSNIKHYYSKSIKDLSPEQAKDLDCLLVEERDKMISLLNMDCVKLKCICWPRLEFLQPQYYTPKERLERMELLRSFLENSLEEKHISRRQMLCDEVGKHGNQLILGDKIAMIANPRFGGYTKTLVIWDPRIIDVLIREYDNLFNRLLQEKREFHELTVNDQNRAMLRDVLKMLKIEKQKIAENEPSCCPG